MIFTSILKFIVVAYATLPSKFKFILIFYLKEISVIIDHYIGVLRINTLYIQSIGSGIRIFNGLFHFIHSLIVNILNNRITQYLIKSIDLLILLTVTVYLIYDFVSINIDCINYLYNFFNIDTIISNMVNQNTTQPHTTEVKFIHDDGSWSNAIRTIFNYGTGALRLNLIRNGGSGNKAFVIASTLATDITTKFINNTINNPEYIKAHYNSWKYVWNNSKQGIATVKVDDETTEKINQALLNNNFTSDSSGMDDISEKIMKFIFETIGPILQPVASSYSTEVLAEQIYHISILLFILSLLITILIFSLLFNIFILINSERILKFFTNKYIKWYVNINLKFIAIELFFLGGSILFFMYDLIKGLHYIATHPIIIS